MKCRSLLKRLESIPKRPPGSPAPQMVSTIAESMRGATVATSRGGFQRAVEFEARFGRLLRRREGHGRNRATASEPVSIPILTPALLKVKGADSYLQDRSISYQSAVDRFAVPFVEKLLGLLELEGREYQTHRASSQTDPERRSGSTQFSEKLTILPLSAESHGDRRWTGFPTYVFEGLHNGPVGQPPKLGIPAPQPNDDLDIDPLGDIGAEAISATATTLKEELAKAELHLSQVSEPNELPITLSDGKGFTGALAGTLIKERLGRLNQFLHLPDNGGCDVKLNFAVEHLTFPPELPLQDLLKRNNVKNCHVRHIHRRGVSVPGTPFRCDWSCVRSCNVPMSTVELLLAADPAAVGLAACADGVSSSQALVQVRRLDTILPREHYELEIELDTEAAKREGPGLLLGPTADWDEQLRAVEQLLELILWIQDELPSSAFVSIG